MVRFIGFFVLILALASCSTMDSEKRQGYRADVSKQKWESAEKELEVYLADKQGKNGLLYHLEKGLLYHYGQRFRAATVELEKAKEIIQKLYTKKVGTKITSFLTGDQNDYYYGTFYEQSLVYFYLSLNYYLISQTGRLEAYERGKEKVPAQTLDAQGRQRYLQMARSEVVAWNGFLETLRQQRLGEAVFKDDLLAKVWGGYIHQRMDSFNDQQIALQLFKDAKLLLIKNYAAYGIYNSKNREFVENFDTFGNREVQDVLKQFIAPTASYQELVRFLDQQILALTHQLRRNEFVQEVKNLGRSSNDHVVLAAQKESNVVILVQNGMIPLKKERVINFGFKGLLENIEDPKTRQKVALVGETALAAFIATVLELTPPAENWSLPGAEMGMQVARYGVREAFGFSFPLPEMAASGPQLNYRAVATGTQGKVDSGSALINPLSELARQAVAEESLALYTRLGVRVGTKHLLAIVSAYAIYQQTKQKEMFPGMAKVAALAAYIAAAKGIDASEKADVRYWSILPQDYQWITLQLPPGEYELKLQQTNQDENLTDELDLPKLTVAKGQHYLIPVVCQWGSCSVQQ